MNSPSACLAPVLTAAPLPLLYGCRTTRAPASRARAAVASLEPSSTTMISRHRAARWSPWTTAPIDGSSSCAGITIETADGSATSGGETEVDDVAVVDDVLLPFEADLAVLAADRHRPSCGQCLVRHDLGADEPPLDVAVNL